MLTSGHSLQTTCAAVPLIILEAWLDLLAILEPLERKVWVTDLHHQLDLVASVYLVGWVQLLSEG